MSAQDFPGSTVGRLHPLVSLQYKLNMMLLRWEGMKRCVEFWIKVMRIDEERLMKVVMLKALEMEVKVDRMGTEFGGKFEDVWMGWNEFRGIGRFVDGEVKKALTEVAWRGVRGVWRQEAQKHPKLDLTGRLMLSRTDFPVLPLHTTPTKLH